MPVNRAPNVSEAFIKFTVLFPRKEEQSFFSVHLAVT
jgi:hypothetical protein